VIRDLSVGEIEAGWVEFASAEEDGLHAEESATLLDLVEERAGRTMGDEAALQADHELIDDELELGAGSPLDKASDRAPVAEAGKRPGGDWSRRPRARRRRWIQRNRATLKGVGGVMAAELEAAAGGAVATNAVGKDVPAKRDGSGHEKPPKEQPASEPSAASSQRPAGQQDSAGEKEKPAQRRAFLFFHSKFSISSGESESANFLRPNVAISRL